MTKTKKVQKENSAINKELEEIFYNECCPRYHSVNSFFAFVTIIAVLSITLETVSYFERFALYFQGIEYAVVLFFSAEYIGRLLGARVPLRYVFSFYGIIDLISILPTFLGIANWSFLKGSRILRILRLLRLLRFLKLLQSRIMKDHEILTHAQKAKKLLHLKVEIYALLFTIVTLGSASLMWFIEGGSTATFESIPRAALWSVKILLGGTFNDPAQTILGQIVMICTRFCGLILFGLLINIIGGVLQNVLFTKKSK